MVGQYYLERHFSGASAVGAGAKTGCAASASRRKQRAEWAAYDRTSMPAQAGTPKPSRRDGPAEQRAQVLRLVWRCSRASTSRSRVGRGLLSCSGPSGSGKSTFLRCINHLEKINAGRIWVDGDLIGYRQRGDQLHEMREKEVAAQRRAIGMVFQRFNLFPHMTALENVMEAPVRVGGSRSAAGAGPGRGAAGPGGAGDKLDAYPAQLSGGQQQRVAIARALAMEPEADALRRADQRARPGAGRRGARRDEGPGPGRA